MNLATLLDGLALRLLPQTSFSNQAVPVAGVSLDSRMVKPGFIFVAAKGLIQDGHAHIAQAMAQGAVAIVLQEESYVLQGASVPFFLSENPRYIAAILCERFYKNPSSKMSVIGVTGTNGKTTVSFIVHAILKAAGKKSAVLGTLGFGEPGHLRKSTHTTPEAEVLSAQLAQLHQEGTQAVCMEVSSHALALDRASGIHFSVAAFTNLSLDHLDFHGDMKAYLAAKERLFLEFLPHGSTAVLPYENTLLQRLKGPSCVSFGKNPQADVSVEDLVCTATQTRGLLCIRTQESVQKYPFETQLVGDFNVENLLCAAAIAHALKITPSSIIGGLAHAKAPAGRLEVISSSPAVIVDFAHTPDALERTLQVLRSITTGKLRLVFGCGGDRDKDKRPIMGAIAARLADMVYVTDDNPRSESPEKIRHAIVQGMKGSQIPYKDIGDRREAIERALREAGPKDIVLIAGKGHEDTQDYGKVVLPFSDVNVARVILEKLV